MRVGTEPHAVEADYAFRDRPWGDAPCRWRGRRGGGLALCGEGLTRLPRTPRGPRSSSRAPEKTLFFFCTWLFGGGTAILLAAALVCEPRTSNSFSRANIQPAGTPSPRTTVKRTHLSPRSWSRRQSCSPGVCATTNARTLCREDCCRRRRVQGQQRSGAPRWPQIQLWSNRAVAGS